MISHPETTLAKLHVLAFQKQCSSFICYWIGILDSVNCTQFLTDRDGLQLIPRESNYKDVTAMLVELTPEADEESFVIFLQHGGNALNMKMVH